jgi:6-phosphofructokinase 1
MVAARDDKWLAVPIVKVAKGIKTVPRDHWWVESARRVGTCLGD